MCVFSIRFIDFEEGNINTDNMTGKMYWKYCMLYGFEVSREKEMTGKF